MSGLVAGVPAGFVLPQHAPAFVEAAQRFDAYILVRRTGPEALKWIGRNGYTAKRGDLKCKTAERDVGGKALAGLVCSPFLQPTAFVDGPRKQQALKEWRCGQQLITVPKRGFVDGERAPCATPYVLQTDPGHPHFGCVAWVECGLVTPRYVHGDYDLYAVVPAATRAVRVAGEMNHGQGIVVSGSLPLSERLRMQDVRMATGPLLFQVMNFLDRAFGYPMVMHAEQENWKHTDEPLIAFLPTPAAGRNHALLEGREAIARFYSDELLGREAARG